jgi:Domain of unknown function (DUF4263)
MYGYIDLTDPNASLEGYRIESGSYNCSLLDDEGKAYKGFLLARSRQGNAFTICDVDFHYSETDDKYPPRLTFRRTDANLQSKNANRAQEYVTIRFHSGEDGYRAFWSMIGFLARYKDVCDLGEFFGRYQAVTRDSVVVRLKERQIGDRMQEIAKYVEESGVSDYDMVELLTMRARKQDVETFCQLLYEDGFYDVYRSEHKADMRGAGGETIWHHFLKSHQWIFGLSLDLRFIEDLLDEQSVGVPDTARRGDPKVDMLGYSDYTVLIELKTPDTYMFTAQKTSNARANTWSFTPEFIEGFSQCLAQKTDWEKASTNRDLVKGDEIFDRGIIRTIDPQVIYIVGNKEREIPRHSNSAAIRTKRDTLERFIRNNRNVNIISYDELYKRAYHIAHGKVSERPVDSHPWSDSVDSDLWSDEAPF